MRPKEAVKLCRTRREKVLQCLKGPHQKTNIFLKAYDNKYIGTLCTCNVF
jgi:hypothetical protein